MDLAWQSATTTQRTKEKEDYSTAVNTRAV